MAVPPKTSTSRRWLIAAAALLVITVIVGIVLATRRGAEPRLNEATTVLAKFVSSKDFERLPFEKQRLYYKVLDDRGNELDDAFKQGRVTEGEYRNALEAAWLGKHLNHVEKYFSLAPGSARANYIDQLVTKKVKKDAKNGKDENVDPDDPRVDETAAELRTELWPSNVRTQWEQFHNVYHQEKKLREKAATRPGTK